MGTTCLFVLALCAFTFVSSEDNNQGDLSQGDEPIPFNKLPKDVQTEFIKILTGTFNALGGSCLGVKPNFDDVELLLYTNDTNKSTRLDSEDPRGIDNDAPLYILSHGYLSGLNGYKIKAFRDKYIELYGKNILYVNWGKIAWLAYTTCACNIPFIGQFVAKMLCTLSEKQNYDLNKVHFIGHSLGGQLAGQTGKGTQKLCNKKIGKITGLDPAGPMFQFTKEETHLTPNDAKFVEVLHSNAGIFGYKGKAGTVDYHLNCGTIQPGCIIPKDFSKIAETSFYVLACPHMRSVEIWPYVLESREFQAKSCKLCGGFMPESCIPDTFGANYFTLGHSYTQPKSENYNLITGPYSPFRLGCKAYPYQGCS